MNCGYCGNELNGDELFCGSCGRKVKQVPQQPQEQTYDFELFETYKREARQPQQNIADYGMNESAERNVRQSVNKPDKPGMSKTAKIIIPVVAVVLVAVIVVLALVLPKKDSDSNSGGKDNTSSIINSDYKFTDNLKNTTIAANEFSTFAVTSDGRINYAGVEYYKNEGLDSWTNVVSVSNFYNSTIALKSDGTPYISMNSANMNFDMSQWTDIVQVSAGAGHVVGLKSDGTVIASGSNNAGQCNVNDWKDIVYIAASYTHTLGVKNDGTVVYTGIDSDGGMEVEGWRDIVSVATGEWITLGLKSDGTVVATPYHEEGNFDVSGWRDIVDISVGCTHAVGLKSDGTVVSTGNTDDERADVSDWRDIVQVAAGSVHTVGLKSDGTLVATGNINKGQCDIEDWRNIMIPVKDFMNYDYSQYTYPSSDFESTQNNTSDFTRLEVQESDLVILQQIINYNDTPFENESLKTEDVIRKLRTIIDFYGYSIYFDDAVSYHSYNNPDYTLDPLGKFEAGYSVFDANNIRWICENIYHIEFDENYELWDSYYYDGYVYGEMSDAGYGESPTNNIVNYTRLEDGKYEIVFNRVYEYETYEDLGNFTVIADIQLIDGERHWTFYSVSDLY